MYDCEYVWTGKWIKNIPLVKVVFLLGQLNHIDSKVKICHLSLWVEVRKGSPVIWSEGMTVEVTAVNEETSSLHHILCNHTQAVQHVAQLTVEKEEEWAIRFVFKYLSGAWRYWSMLLMFNSVIKMVKFRLLPMGVSVFYRWIKVKAAVFLTHCSVECLDLLV